MGWSATASAFEGIKAATGDLLLDSTFNSEQLLSELIIELKKMNVQFNIMTDNEITSEDVDGN